MSLFLWWHTYIWYKHCMDAIDNIFFDIDSLCCQDWKWIFTIHIDFRSLNMCLFWQYDHHIASDSITQLYISLIVYFYLSWCWIVLCVYYFYCCLILICSLISCNFIEMWKWTKICAAFFLISNIKYMQWPVQFNMFYCLLLGIVNVKYNANW